MEIIFVSSFRNRRRYAVCLYAAMFLVLLHPEVVAPQSIHSSDELRFDKTSNGFDRSNLVVSLERKGCFGTCPQYKVTVFGDGRVDYVGFQHVKTIGRAETQISASAIAEMKAALAKSRYFYLRSSYGFISDGCSSPNADSPTAYTTVQQGKKTKSIKRSDGCSDIPKDSSIKRLVKFELEVDRLVGIEKWIGTPEERANLKQPLLLLPRQFSF